MIAGSRDLSLDDIPEPIEKGYARDEMSKASRNVWRKGDTKKGQLIKKHEGIKHAGTQEFANNVNRKRKKEKAAKVARRKNRKGSK